MERRSFLQILTTAALMKAVTPLNSFAATFGTIPVDLECDWRAGFVSDHNEGRRIGYLTSFQGVGMAKPLAADIKVLMPFDAPTYKPVVPINKQLSVVGVIESINWNGGVGDPLRFSTYVTQENAAAVKAMQQTAVQITKINTLGFWVGDYDQEQKRWFDQFYPLNQETISGIIAGKENPSIGVSLEPQQVSDNIDFKVYNLTFEVAPAANMSYTLHFANSSIKTTTKQWGLKVGTFAGTMID